MKFFKRPHVLRRFKEPKIVRGYSYIPFDDLTLPMDVQTLEDKVITTPDGNRSVQRLKVFCDSAILVENVHSQQKADRIWFQDTWFECKSSRLSNNTPLRHWTATFVECLDQEEGPKVNDSELDIDGNTALTDENGIILTDENGIILIWSETAMMAMTDEN